MCAIEQARRNVAATLIIWLATSIAAHAADIAAGQKICESSCAACHQLAGYAGKSESELATELKGMVAGTMNHPKKLTLSATDIANVATTPRISTAVLSSGRANRGRSAAIPFSNVPTMAGRSACPVRS
jgi:mono/diheme cytochrome c family protein